MIPSVPSAALSAFLLLSIYGAPGASQNITSDSYFYGQSPYVPPVPLPSGTTSSWASAYSKAAAFVAQLSQEEKSNLTYGASSKTGCVGYIPPISRLGFKGLCLQDAGNGVRLADGVNAWPSGLHMGAT
jgi:beta-glucosidase